jgi:catechol 2,3-dioxygenase-like lactoylglutathione lyase family enzyme
MKQMTQWIVFAVSAVLAIPLAAQTTAQPAAPAQSPDLTGIAHIAFRVSDLDKEVNFFGKMGFEEAFSDVENGRTLQVFIKVNDRQFIEVYPQGDRPAPLGFMHVCYESADLNALHAKYIAAGLHPTPVRTAAAGNLLFTLLDPDSRTVEFTQYMPDSRHMRDRGQHLGDNRVSDELLGFELPVTNLDGAAKFYSSLGFDAEQDGAGYRLSIPANPDLRIELHSARLNDQPQFLFPVEDAHHAANQLHSAGLSVQRNKKLVFVRDPDGNAFVLLETGEHTPHRLIPWEK